MASFWKSWLVSGVFVCGLAAWTPPGQGRRNVLFLICDDLRPQLRRAYGQEFMHTPNIDRLADTALTFDFAYANIAICSPSRNSFLSGRLPDNTRTWNFIDDFRSSGMDAEGSPGVGWKPLPEYLKNNGYRVYGHGKIYHPGKPAHDDQPRSWSPDQPYWPLTGQMGCPLVDIESSQRYCPGTDNFTHEYSDYEMVGHALDTLRKVAADYMSTGRNFGVFIGLHYPHQPWHTPDWTRKAYPPAGDLPPPRHPYSPTNSPDIAFNAELDGGTTLTLNESLPGFEDSKPESVSGIVTYPCPHPGNNSLPLYFQQQLRLGYYSAVTLADYNLGRVLDLLEELKLDNSTIVILTGDHGWQLGEHAEWGKHNNFELSLQVPLLIRAPGTPTAGKHTQSPAELLDLYRTAVSLAGLPPPEASVDGHDLSELLHQPHKTLRELTFAQYARCPGMRLWPRIFHGKPDWFRNNCERVPASNISFMGYSVRNFEWRYTEWYKWNGTSCSVDFGSLPYATELYSHVGQTPYPLDFDAWENENVVGAPENAGLVQQLKRAILDRFGSVARWGCPVSTGRMASLEEPMEPWMQNGQEWYV